MSKRGVCQSSARVLESICSYLLEEWKLRAVHIYRADLRDLTACLTLDGSYETDHVWQVTQQQEDDQVVTRFRTVRLPRTMRVQYPGWSEALLPISSAAT